MSDRSSLLLDTHYWIWLQAGDQSLPGAVARMIQEAAAAGSLLVSILSVWEVGMLESKGRIRLSSTCAEWVEEALATPGLSLAPLTPEIALDSTRLPGDFHGDPVDRILVATARRLGARLMTKDRKLIEYGQKGHVNVL